MAHYHYAWGLYLWGGMEEAIAEYKLAQKYDPYNPLHTAWLGGLYNYAGRNEEAIKTHQKLSELNPNQPNEELCYTYIKTGHREEAEKILIEVEKREVTPSNACSRAIIYAALGRKDEAFKWLKYEPHSAVLAWTAVVPNFNSLHGDPRWDEFVKNLNLPKK